MHNKRLDTWQSCWLLLTVTGVVPAGQEDTPWRVALHQSTGHAIVLSDSSSGTSWLRVISTSTLQQVGLCRTLSGIGCWCSMAATLSGAFWEVL